MGSNLQSLQDDLEYYSLQLNRVGEILVSMMDVEWRYPALLLEAGKLYELLTSCLVETYKSMELELQSIS